MTFVVILHQQNIPGGPPQLEPYGGSSRLTGVSLLPPSHPQFASCLRRHRAFFCRSDSFKQSFRVPTLEKGVLVRAPTYRKSTCLFKKLEMKEHLNEKTQNQISGVFPGTTTTTDHVVVFTSPRSAASMPIFMDFKNI